MPYYTLVDFPREGETYGEYEGRTPKLAANKILTILARKIKLNNSNNSDNSENESNNNVPPQREIRDISDDESNNELNLDQMIKDL